MNCTVSVCVITYNHEQYIAEAINSILSQRTEFDIEIVIGEDCSTDKTREICTSLQRKHPDKIRLLLREKNLGPLGNLTNTLSNCKGRFVALLEGDDYWTDPLKLQKQVNVLENGHEFSGCFHDTYKEFEFGSKELFNDLKVNILFPEDTLSTRALFHTSSFLFKREFLDFPDWFLNVLSADMALFSIISKNGKLIRIPEVMSCYRQHSGGISKSTHHQKNWILGRIELMAYLYKYHSYQYPEKFVDTVSFYVNLYKGVKPSVPTRRSYLFYLKKILKAKLF